MILADTSVWIDYQRNPRSTAAPVMDSLLLNGEVVMAGPIMAEVLAGASDDAEYQFYYDHFRDSMQFLEDDLGTWSKVAELAYQLKVRGRLLPIVDLLIAALAIRYDCSLYTLDRGFRRIPGLRFYDPAEQNT